MDPGPIPWADAEARPRVEPTRSSGRSHSPRGIAGSIMQGGAAAPWTACREETANYLLTGERPLSRQSPWTPNGAERKNVAESRLQQ